MAAKRFLEDSDPNPYQSNEKRIKSKPSFSSVIEQVRMVNFYQNLVSALEPMLRKVVYEEVEDGLKRSARYLTKSPSLRIQALPPPSTLHLTFATNISLPIFTGTKILDVHGNPLQIMLVDTATGGGHISPATPVKVEIVVLDGDFPPGERDTWSREEFDGYIVKERTGRRPLLTGELQVNMRDGFAPVGQIEFTDNSSWIRSRKFRVAARVVEGRNGGQGVRIREAISEAFVVKDHRGELYKKHYPPMLHDDVWRLEKIGKGGSFHKKLASGHIKTVQDFLKLSVVDQPKLRKILGVGMSDRMWEITLKHARTCVMGNKLYISRGPNYNIYLNPICQVAKAEINGEIYSSRDLTRLNKAYIGNLVRDAYANWNILEEVDGFINDTALLTQGDMEEQYTNEEQSIVRSYHHHQHNHAFITTDGSTSASPNIEWMMINNNSTHYHPTLGDLPPPTSFIHGP